jgi:hypothetical protein
MATVSSPSALANQPARSATTSTSWPVAILQVFGSLKLTVVLFSVALVLVFAGTLAQHHLNMLEVKERYFTSWVAMMHFEDLAPYAFFPHETPFRGAIPIPGGALVGALLMLNLIAAKITRFHVHAARAHGFMPASQPSWLAC